MKKLFVGSLPPEASEEWVRELFAQYGTVRSVDLAVDIFTRRCRGFGFVEMEGHEARAAMSGLDGSLHNGNHLRVRFDEPKPKRGGRRR